MRQRKGGDSVLMLYQFCEKKLCIIVDTALKLSCIGTELCFSKKQHLRYKDQQKADGRCGCHFSQKVNKIAKLEPLEQYQEKMVYESEDADI